MISVIITTYAREMQILRRAIETVYKQTYRDIELIVVNDYPPYKNLIQELLSEYEKVVFLSHDERKGACQARNDGLYASRGEYIAFLDDDDEWEDEKLEKQLEFMRTQNVDFVYCSGITLNDITGQKNRIPFIHGCQNGEYVSELLKGNFMGGCSFPLMKRSVLIELGGFDVDMPSSQDYELWLRAAENHTIAFLNETLVIYHVGFEAITTNPKKRIDGFCKLYEKHIDVFNRYPKEARVFFKTMVWTAIYADRKDLLPSILSIIKLKFPNNIYIWVFKNLEIIKKRIKDFLE